jgi:Cu/Ag efflux pump CusA
MALPKRIFWDLESTLCVFGLSLIGCGHTIFRLRKYWKLWTNKASLLDLVDLGQSSGIQAQSLEYVLNYKGRYNKPEEYENIIIRSNEEGELIKLKDIASVELGSEFFDIYSNLDGRPSSSIVLKQTPNSNGSDVIAQVKDKLAELEKDFPAGIRLQIQL